MISETYNIDCKYFLSHCDIHFDLSVSDPPNIKGPAKKKFYGQAVSSRNIKRREYPPIETWELPDLEWFELLNLRSDVIIIWGANYYDFIGPVHDTPRPKDLAKWLEEHPTGWIVWDKCNLKSSYNDYELAWTNVDQPTIIYKFMWNGMNQGKNIFEGHIMQGNKKLNELRIHQTQKPVFLYKWLYFTYAKPGFKILDPYLGSGSSRIAAYEMGFDFWGCEINEVNYNRQEDRWQKFQHKELSQTKIFV